jgi:hypothetical protein
MVYGSKVVLPSELQYGSPRVWSYQPIEAEQALHDIADSLEKSRDIAVAR